MEDLTISIREKTQYETFSAYLEDIKKSVEKQNSNIMQTIMKKDSEIAELKSKVASLEAGTATAEKSEAETQLLETVKEVLSRVTESGTKTDTIIERIDEFIKKQNIIEQECKNIYDKITDLGNTESRQYDVAKQEELEDIAKDIYAVVMDLKNQSLAAIKNNEEEKEEDIDDTLAGALNSDFNNEVVEEQPVVDNNVIEETNIEAPVAENVEPTPDIMTSAPELPEEGEKVIAEEVAAPEMTEEAKQVVGLDATNTKAVRAGVNYLHDKKDQEQPFSMDSIAVNNAELPPELNESFRSLEANATMKR